MLNRVVLGSNAEAPQGDFRGSAALANFIFGEEPFARMYTDFAPFVDVARSDNVQVSKLISESIVLCYPRFSFVLYER